MPGGAASAYGVSQPGRSYLCLWGQSAWRLATQRIIIYSVDSMRIQTDRQERLLGFKVVSVKIGERHGPGKFLSGFHISVVS